jgi:hypothetical protein
MNEAGSVGLICWTWFSEEFVIHNVFDSSPEFRAFYEAERSKLGEPIYWVHDPRGTRHSTEMGLRL